MESNSLFHRIKGDLISFGFLFYGDPSQTIADPESTLIQSLQFFYEDRKIFRMLLRWCLTVAPLIHVERLRKQSEALDSKLVPVLGALSKKMVISGDRRFNLIFEDMQNRHLLNKINTVVPEGYVDRYLLEKYGEDQEFKEFNVLIAQIEPEDQKKIMTLKEIVKIHFWFYIRALIGPNFRADLVFCLTQKLVKNPNQAAKFLGCSRETAYRLWKDIALVGNLENLPKPF